MRKIIVGAGRSELSWPWGWGPKILGTSLMSNRTADDPHRAGHVDAVHVPRTPAARAFASSALTFFACAVRCFSFSAVAL
ncbi:hypothetical protein SMICM17S_10946 [Streptomyces microflavus]